MIDLFDEYARIAFATDEGHKNPEKPTRPLEELERAFDIGELVARAVDNFCWQHITIERLHNGETTPEHLPHEDTRLFRDRFDQTRRKFVKLFNVGIFSLAVQIHDGDITILMRIWDGERYRPATEVLEMIIPPGPPTNLPAYENPPSQ